MECGKWWEEAARRPLRGKRVSLLWKCKTVSCGSQVVPVAVNPLIAVWWNDYVDFWWTQRVITSRSILTSGCSRSFKAKNVVWQSVIDISWATRWLLTVNDGSVSWKNNIHFDPRFQRKNFGDGVAESLDQFWPCVRSALCERSAPRA